MSSLFGSTIIKGNRLTDFANTTATVGVVIPWGVGSFTSNGNAIWAHLPPTEHVSRKRQGKGGTKVETYTYTLNYAIAFAKGQLYGYRWIKRAGKVVYTNDPNAPVEDQEYATKWLQKATLYHGTRDQAPDSTIESYEGAGMVSAFKDLGYIVLEEDDVTDNGGAVPNYEACVIASPPEAYLTSKVYPQILYEEAELGIAPTGGELKRLLYEADLQNTDTEFTVAPTGGDMFEVPPPEFHDDTELGVEPTGGELRSVLKDGTLQSANIEPTVAPTSGKLAVPPVGSLGEEDIGVGLAITGGEMVTPPIVVVSLLHFDGADGSTSFIDETGRIWSIASGSPEISTDEAAFGGSSLSLPSTGASISTPGTSDFAFGTGDFTIECWIDPRKVGSGNGDGILFTNGLNVSGGMLLALNTGYGLELRTTLSNRLYIPDVKSIAAGGIGFLSVCRAGTTVYVGVNGAVSSYSYDFGNISFDANIILGWNTSNAFHGYMDDLRITKGLARYTSNYTPPASPFPNS